MPRFGILTHGACFPAVLKPKHSNLETGNWSPSKDSMNFGHTYSHNFALKIHYTNKRQSNLVKVGDIK